MTGPHEIAAYIAVSCARLKQLASTSDLKKLAGLLAVAEMEAYQFACVGNNVKILLRSRAT